MLSELYDAIFGWLEHKDLRTPSRELRMMLQSYRASNTGKLVSGFGSTPPKIDHRCFQNFRCMLLSLHYTISLCDASKAA
jgi:hypothetical protein